MALFFETGFRLSTPVIGTILLVNIGMGILAKAAPQMNMFVLGMPIKVLILLIMLTIIVEAMTGYNNLIIDLIANNYFNILEGLRYVQ